MFDPRDVITCVKKLGKRQRIRAVAIHAHGQRLKTLQEQERVHGRLARTEVTQAFDADLNDESDWPQGLGKLQAVITRAGLGDLRELATRYPVELARIDDHAADSRAMPANKLVRRVHHDIRTMLNRTAKVGRRERVVDHQRDARRVSDLGNPRDIDNNSSED